MLENDIASFLVIQYLHINHNTPCLPPKFLHKYCFQVVVVIIYRLRGDDFSGDHLIIGRKKRGSGVIGNNADAKLFEGKQGIFWECESSELRLGSEFVPKNSPTVEFDTSVVHLKVIKAWVPRC